MGKKRCKVVNDNLANIGQYIIFFMNRVDIRGKIIKEMIRKERKKKIFQYCGTWYVEGKKNKLKFTDPDDDNIPFDRTSKYLNVNRFMKTCRETFCSEKKILFTVVYCYEEGNVHFVAFIYDPMDRTLKHFDPGIHLYPVGQNIIVPSIHKAFYDAKLVDKKNVKSDDEIGKDCKKFIYGLKDRELGIQYNGVNKDAFCQSWTLQWLLDNIQKYNKSIKKYCIVKPKNRVLYLFQHFIIPLMEDHPNYLKNIIKEYKEDKELKSESMTAENILKLLKQKVKVCK